MAENHALAPARPPLAALTDWERRPRNTMRVGLEPMRDLATRLGDPQKSFRSIHVAGTKGKGSVSALIEAALAHAGLRVGRLASCGAHHRAGQRSGTRRRRTYARASPRYGARRLRGRAQGWHARGQRD